MDPAQGQPDYNAPGIPPNADSCMPVHTGIAYNPSGYPASGGGGAKFGGKWICMGLVGLSETNGGSSSASPVYFANPRGVIRFMPPPPGGDVYKPNYFQPQTMRVVTEAGQPRYCILEPSGNTKYFDKTTGRIEAVAGQCGNRTNYSYDSSNKVTSIATAFDDGANKYEYTWSGEQISEVLYKVGGDPVTKAVYAYDSSGNLKTIKIYHNSATGSTPVWGSPASATLYSYHADGRIRHIVPPVKYRQMVNNGITPESATESQLNEYAATEYFYDGDRVSLMYKKGRKYSYGFAYAFNYPSGTDLNQWTTRTTVTLSDGTQRVYYYNRIGQLMLLKVAESSASTAKTWNKLYQKFDPDNGRLVLSAGDSAIAAVDESDAGLVTLNETAGLIKVYTYTASGRMETYSLKEGSTGTAILQKSWGYVTRSATDKGDIYLVSSETVYPDESGTSGIETTYSYSDWYAADSFQFAKQVTHLPVIPTSQNGTGATLTTERHYNPRGLLTKTVDERGTVTEFEWDELRGGVVKKTQDPSGLNLITNYTLDNRGREVRELGPVHEIDLGGTATNIRSARWTYYKDSEATRWSFSGYQTTASTPVNQIEGPVTILQFNIAPPSGTEYSGWRQASVIQAQFTGTGIPSPTDSFAQSSWLRWSLSLYDKGGELKESRTYSDIPSSGYGSRSSNYGRSLYAYDSLGRRNQTTDPGDTVDKTTYNAMAWPVKRETGTVSASLVTILTNIFDDDGNLTKATVPVDSASSHNRVTDYAYDWRGRRFEMKTIVERDGGGTTWTLITRFGYDNRNLPTEVTGYHTSVTSSRRISYRTSAYDNLGRPFQSSVYGVDASGNTSNPQVSNRYYSKTGQVARKAPAGSKLFTATTYDAVGRTKLVSQAYEPSGHTAGADPAALTNAVVLTQQEMFWNAAGNLTSSTSKQRFDTATGNGDLGNLTTEPKARTSYEASYPDALGRTIASANYGTNGSASWTRNPTVPARTDDVLVTSFAFNTAGNVASSTDPAAIVTTNSYDDAGRLTSVVENSSGASGTTRTTRYEYTDDNGLKKLISQNPSTGEQVTEWVRGVTTAQGSALNSNRLVYQKIYPDSGGSPDLVTYNYNRQGQVTRMTDQAATVHSYTYDKLGRLLKDSVAFAAGTDLDTTVGILETGYNERGLVVRSTSLNPAGDTILNEVKSAYNKFNQLETEWQEHFGSVNTSTSRKVQYTYENGSANTIRPTGITNPDGTHITTGYSSGMGNAISRPDLIEEGSSTLASMKYLGLGTPVELKYDSAGGALWTMKNATTGDIYTGLDRFGRLVETIWKTSSADLVHTKYGRNRVGGVVWQRNELAHSMSPEVKTQDNFYAYDGLQQVKLHQRGDLWPHSGPPYTGVADLQQQEDFVFDETGNWLQYVSNAPTLDQHRTHDKANQIATISNPTGVVQPSFDPVGNMTRMPKTSEWTSADELTWDAWNRLVKVRPVGSGSSSSSSSSSSSPSSSTSASGSASSSDSSSPSSGSGSSSSSTSSAVPAQITYQYDALTRRTRKVNAYGPIDYYYDRQWRAVEERVYSTVAASYVWSPVDRWTMIRRKRPAESEPRYVLKDYLDPAAVIDTSAAVVERFGFDAFGPVRFMDASFATRTASTLDWNFLFHAEFLDTDSGLYNYGFRYYHPELGRWMSRDPIGEEGGLNLYLAVRNSWTDRFDLYGLLKIDKNDYPFTIHETGGPGGERACSITIDVGHGGMRTSRTTKRADERIKNSGSNKCDKFLSVGCGANRLNERYNKSGIGVPAMPPWLYPINNYVDPHDSKILERNGFEGSDLCQATQLISHIDQAIIAASAYASRMAEAPCCCKTVIIYINCQGSVEDPGDLAAIEEGEQGRTGRKPVCGTSLTISNK